MTARTEIQKPEPTTAQPPDPAYEAALRGADFLDRELGPNWEDRIDPATLDISSGCYCVIGQVINGGRSGWGDTMRRLGIFGQGSHYGFNGDDRTTAAWLRVLSEREAARKGEGA